MLEVSVINVKIILFIIQFMVTSEENPECLTILVFLEVILILIHFRIKFL
jgi:hypothetical protein